MGSVEATVAQKQLFARVKAAAVSAFAASLEGDGRRLRRFTCHRGAGLNRPGVGPTLARG
jgi:hypothetical protein